MPDPILGLVCLVGLFAYSAVGAVVGALTVRVFDSDLKIDRGGYVRGIAGWKGMRTATERMYGGEYQREFYGDNDGWIYFTIAAVFWPAVLAGGIAVAVSAASLFATLVGPVFVAKKIGRYLALAQIKDGTDAA